jgi:hypothetical protein
VTYTVEKTTEPIKLENGDRVISLEQISENARDLFRQLEHLRSVLTLASETAKDTFQIVYAPLDVNSISALTGCLSLSVELTNSIQNDLDVKIEMPLWTILNAKPALSVSDEKAEFLAYFREYYPKMMELLSKVKEKESIALVSFKHDDDLLAQKIDEFWQPISEAEQKKIFNLMECL